MTFTILAALAGLFLGRLLACWADRLPFEDVETAVRVPVELVPPLGARRGIPRGARRARSERIGGLGALTAPFPPLDADRAKSARAIAPGDLPLDPWLVRLVRYLRKSEFLEEDFHRLRWYQRFPLINLLFRSSGSVALRWYDKVPLVPYFVYAVKFSNYRALLPRVGCHRCGESRGAADWLPLGSVFRGGLRCPSCGTWEGAVRPLVELSTALLFGIFAARFGPTWYLAGHLVLVSAFVVCATVDWQYQIIPDELNTLGLGLGLAFAIATQSMFALGWLDDAGLAARLPADYDRYYSHVTVLDSLAGFLAGAGVLLLLGRVGTMMAGTDALGGGDIKIAGFIGAFLGWRAVLISLFYSSLIGAVAGGIVLWMGRGGHKEHGFTKFAFGPYICMGTLLVMYFGAETMFFSYMNANNWMSLRLSEWLYERGF